MTVKELIEILQKHDQYAFVFYRPEFDSDILELVTKVEDWKGIENRILLLGI